MIVVTSLWRSKTGLRALDQVVMHIIVITLESAALPSSCMLVAVGLYHASPVRTPPITSQSQNLGANRSTAP